jgi:hypothetical protein
MRGLNRTRNLNETGEIAQISSICTLRCGLVACVGRSSLSPRSLPRIPSNKTRLNHVFLGRSELATKLHLAVFRAF